MSGYPALGWARVQQPAAWWFKELRRGEVVWVQLRPSDRKAVLLALATYCDEAGECYPSVATLARDCSMGERTVQRILASLVEDRYVRRIPHGAPGRLATLTQLAFVHRP